MKTITEAQAIKAYSMIEAIIHEAFPNGTHHGATQINLHPSYVQEMRQLVEEVKNNP